MAGLEERCAALWLRFGADAALAAAGAAEVVAAYAGQNRFYHTQAHLEDVLEKLDWAKTAFEETADLPAEDRQSLFDTVELALWYHDAIYDARRKDNEAKSRDLFLAHANQAGLEAPLQRDVAELIELTANHAEAGTLKGRLLADCDLAILGAPPAEFAAYDANIRREYEHVPLPLYKIARRDVLKGFLAQDAIFKTGAFHRRFEDDARRNLVAALLSENVLSENIRLPDPGPKHMISWKDSARGVLRVPGRNYRI